MKSSIKGLITKSTLGVNRCCALLFLFFILSSSGITAQDSSAVAQQDSSAINNSENELLENMKKTGSAMTEEMKKMKERQAHEEFMGYVYMVLGFSTVIFVAWFSTVKAKQYRERQEEKKRKFLEARMANQPKSTHAQHRSSAQRRGHRR